MSEARTPAILFTILATIREPGRATLRPVMFRESRFWERKWFYEVFHTWHRPVEKLRQILGSVQQTLKLSLIMKLKVDPV